MIDVRTLISHLISSGSEVVGGSRLAADYRGIHREVLQLYGSIYSFELRGFITLHLIVHYAVRWKNLRIIFPGSDRPLSDADKCKDSRKVADVVREVSKNNTFYVFKSSVGLANMRKVSGSTIDIVITNAYVCGFDARSLCKLYNILDILGWNLLAFSRLQ